jgi:hypothetical protein
MVVRGTGSASIRAFSSLLETRLCKSAIYKNFRRTTFLVERLVPTPVADRSKFLETAQK